MATVGSASPQGPGPGYRWVALSNTTLGVLMASLNSSIVLISLPAIFRGIGLNALDPANTSYLLWMIMGYLVVTAVLVVGLGRVGDMYGRVRVYNLGFVIFTAGSVLLAATPGTGDAGALQLVLFRVVQGVGGAMLMANSAAILTDAFPYAQRGLALGVNGVAAIAGQFIGLLAGGLLAAVHWRSVFIVSVPVGLAGSLWAYRSLREIGEAHHAPMDWWGNLTFAAGLVALLVGITYGIQPAGTQTMSWTTAPVLAELAGGAALLVVFVAVEARARAPMFRLDLFRSRAFTAGNVAGLCSAVGRGGLMLMLVVWLQGIWLPLHGYSFEVTPLWAGIYMLPMTVGFLVAGPISGALSDRFGARPFATSGMLAAAVTFALLMRLPPDFAYAPFAALLFFNGLAMGLFSSPNTAAIMNSVPPDQRGAASGMRATFQNAGQTLSIGLFFSLMIVGLAGSLPQAMYQGLVGHGLSAASARQVAGLPPVGLLFAAFLGYNPMQSLLGSQLNALPAAAAADLTGKTFFPDLIAAPFDRGLQIAFAFAMAMMLVAAAASWLRGGRYVFDEAQAEGAAAGRLPAAGGAPAARARRGLPSGADAVPAADAGQLPLVVTISAAYGAGGGYVGPRVAARLGLPFLDRAIPVEVAHRLAVSPEAALARDETAVGGFGRLLAAVAPVAVLSGPSGPGPSEPLDDEAFRLQAEAVMRQAVARTGAVILGRGASVVFAGRPNTLRVRLTGPVGARVRRAMALEHVDAATARRQQRETDPARRAYLRHLYRVDIDDPRLYQVVLDATEVELDDAVELIVRLARRAQAGGAVRDTA